MTNSLLVINLNKFLHTRGLAKSANSDYNLKYIIRFALVNSIRIYKKNSWNHCRLDVINFSIHGGLYWILTAAANKPLQWGAPKGGGLILIGPGGQFCAETALDWKINYGLKTTMPSEIFTYSYRVHQGQSGDVF